MLSSRYMKMEIQFNKNINFVSCAYLNIGEEQFNNIKISSWFWIPSTWDTELRTYKEIRYLVNMFNVLQELSEREWKEYSNKMLEEPLKCVDIEYDDLVGFDDTNIIDGGNDLYI